MSKISDKLNIIDNAKNDIKTAIENKGINVGDVGLQEYAGKIGEIKAPVPVTKGIVINAFDGDGYPTDVSVVGMTTIPSNYLYVNNSFFSKLNKVVLPNETSNIGNYAFAGCSNLILTELPSKITYLGASAFQGCVNLALTKLTNGLSYMGTYCFSGCSNLNLSELPSGIREIPNYCFASCTNLTSLQLHDNIIKIGSYAFQNCSNLALTKLPSKLSSIGSYAFTGCSNLEISEIPDSVGEISSNAFYNCSKIQKIKLSSNIKLINSQLFRYCTSLTEVTCNASTISNIYTYAFNGCSSLSKFVLSGITSVPTLQNTNAFINTPIANGTGYIYVPDDLVDSFKTASNWSIYASQIKGISELEG